MVAINVSVKLDDVINVFNHSFNDLLDEDVVCVFLLYQLEKGLNDRLIKEPILKEYFILVSNIDEFKRYHVVNL